MDFVKNALALTLSFTIIACSSSPEIKSDPNAVLAYQQRMDQRNADTQRMLARAAAQSAKAITAYVKTNQAKVQPLLTADQVRQARFQNNYIPAGMEILVELPWAGAPEPLLKQVESLSQYKLVYKNQRPQISKPVVISKDKKNLKQILESVQQQAAGYIEDIYIDDQSTQKKIIVTYARF